MIYSSRQDRKTKAKIRAIAEVLAMIATAPPPFAQEQLNADAEGSPFESATEFCTALEIYASRRREIRN
ncbi:MAG TPA: hypothetical protein VEK34_09555 [Methylocella sp.]|nr:hypothetical protein [Methylocella sp.]